jgi:hypothetical protein
MVTLRLDIAPIIHEVRSVAERVRTELPAHDGLLEAAEHIARAGEWALRLSKSMRKPWSPHKLPVAFLALALSALLVWSYFHFVYVSKLTLALPDVDAASLKKAARTNSRLRFVLSEVKGSMEAAHLVATNQVDMAFVQGGIELPARLARVPLENREYLFLLMRPGKRFPSDVHLVMTSSENEGSHAVARDLFSLLGQPVAFRYGWRNVLDPSFTLEPDIDAVLVVKDVFDTTTLVSLEKLQRAGFELRSLDLGLRGKQLRYLESLTLEAGSVMTSMPEQSVKSYAVVTYLVAREGLGQAALQEALKVLHPAAPVLERHVISATETAELLQGVDAFFSILINIGLAFLALTGLDVWAYRKPFHELNSLVSLLSLLQSDKDVLGIDDEVARKNNLLYLSLVSDLLSLVSAVSGYYTQENSSLLFNRQSEVVHQRCDALKLNIQLKILHASVSV